MKRKQAQRTAGDITREANELGKDALVQAQAYLAQAQDYLGPRAQSAFQQAQDYIGPRARDAKAKGAQFAANAVDAARPRIEDALDRVGPAVDSTYQRMVPVIDEARNKVQNSLLPWVSDTLHQAATSAANIELPEVARHITVVEEPVKKTSPVKRMGQFLLVGGLIAVIVVALKKFLAPTDSGWQAHEPATPYTPPAPATAPTTEDAAEAYLAEDTAADVADEPAPTETVDDTEAAAQAASAEASATEDDAQEDDAAPFADSPYGEGSYVGTEPPEGFVIKGNERSMKFHVKGNGGYERTIADVWFNSEEAAEAAGFTKAQR